MAKVTRRIGQRTPQFAHIHSCPSAIGMSALKSSDTL
jgi:hypothetical protein